MCYNLFLLEIALYTLSTDVIEYLKGQLDFSFDMYI